ncbi:hypothetical protein SPM24T3_16131 [Serratia sp. M24T3]|nr:hypothetical protein SPM24T3_16131 [Serratia sp. M24T3]
MRIVHWRDMRGRFENTKHDASEVLSIGIEMFHNEHPTDPTHEDGICFMTVMLQKYDCRGDSAGFINTLKY